MQNVLSGVKAGNDLGVLDEVATREGDPVTGIEAKGMSTYETIDKVKTEMYNMTDTIPQQVAATVKPFDDKIMLILTTLDDLQDQIDSGPRRTRSR